MSQERLQFEIKKVELHMIQISLIKMKVQNKENMFSVLKKLMIIRKKLLVIIILKNLMSRDH